MNTDDPRKIECDRVKGKYPDRVVIWVEKASHASADTPQIDRHKFLTPRDLTLGQFAHVIRKRIKLQPGQALFLSGQVEAKTGLVAPLLRRYYKPIMFSSSELLSELAEKYADPCGYLYIFYSCEGTFG